MLKIENVFQRVFFLFPFQVRNRFRLADPRRTLARPLGLRASCFRPDLGVTNATLGGTNLER